MKRSRSRTWISAILLLAGFAACMAALASAHYDPPHNIASPTVGVYRASLYSIKVLPQGGFKTGQRVNLLVHTFAEAEGHLPGEDAVFDVIARVGEVTPIDSLIYWHVDCEPSERIQLIIDASVAPAKIGEPVAGFLQAGGGIVTMEDPQRPHTRFPDAPGSRGRIDTSIARELALSPKHFPQYNTDPAFALDPNAGTVTGAPRGVAATSPKYEFTLGLSYTDVPGPPPNGVQGCRSPASIESSYTQLEQSDSNVRKILYRTSMVGGGYTREEVAACPTHNRKPPRYEHGRCGLPHRVAPTAPTPLKCTQHHGSLPGTNGEEWGFLVSCNKLWGWIEIVGKKGSKIVNVDPPSGWHAKPGRGENSVIFENPGQVPGGSGQQFFVMWDRPVGWPFTIKAAVQPTG